MPLNHLVFSLFSRCSCHVSSVASMAHILFPLVNCRLGSVVNCRLGSDECSGQSTTGLFICAVCQVDLAPSEGISVHAGSIFSMSSKLWQGPFLCADCRDKKDAMEGKRPSGVKVA